MDPLSKNAPQIFERWSGYKNIKPNVIDSCFFFLFFFGFLYSRYPLITVCSFVHVLKYLVHQSTIFWHIRYILIKIYYTTVVYSTLTPLISFYRANTKESGQTSNHPHNFFKIWREDHPCQEAQSARKVVKYNCRRGQTRGQY